VVGRVVIDGFDVVAVGVEHEGSVVVWVIVGSESGIAVAV